MFDHLNFLELIWCLFTADLTQQHLRYKVIFYSD